MPPAPKTRWPAFRGVDPGFLPPESAPDTRLVGRAEAALAALAAQGVGMVLSGHLHLGWHCQLVRR